MEDKNSLTYYSASISEDGNKVTLNYSKELSKVTAAASSFIIKNNGAIIKLKSVSTSENRVILELLQGVRSEEEITLEYRAPKTNSSQKNRAVQDLSGNDALSISKNTPVINNSQVDGKSPQLNGSYVDEDGNKIILNFSEVLDKNTAAASAFIIRSNGNIIKAKLVMINGDMASIFLEKNIRSEEIVLIDYKAPAQNKSNKNKAIQDPEGNDALKFTKREVINGSKLDGSSPTCVSSEITGDGKILLRFTEELSEITATPSAFIIQSNDIKYKAKSISINGKDLIIETTTEIERQYLTLTYKPKSQNKSLDNKAVQDINGNDAAGFSLKIEPPPNPKSNTPPTGRTDILSATEDKIQKYSPSQLLENDFDNDNNLLRIKKVISGTGGIATLNPDNTINFSPSPNFSGRAEFSYVATDGEADSNVIPVHVDVINVNDAPEGQPDTLQAQENTSINYFPAQLLGNDTDIDSTTLKISKVISEVGGAATLNPDGSIEFMPEKNFIGSASFKYIISDEQADSLPINVIVNVNGINDEISEDYSSNAQTKGFVAIGGSTRGNIQFVGDKDWFKVDLVAGSTYIFDLSGFNSNGGTLGSGGDTAYLSLFDRSGQFIDAQTSGGTSGDPRMSFQPTTSGTYYLQASELGDDALGTYTIKALQSTVVDDFSADTQTTGFVAIGGSTQGNIQFVGDKDWFKVDLVAGSTYIFDLSGFNSNGGTLGSGSDTAYLSLFDRSGRFIDAQTSGGTGGDPRMSLQPTTSGTYYLQASELGDDALGNYEVIVTLIGNSQ